MLHDLQYFLCFQTAPNDRCVNGLDSDHLGGEVHSFLLQKRWQKDVMACWQSAA